MIATTTNNFGSMNPVALFRRHRKYGFILLSLISTAVCLALAFVLAQTLLLSDVNFDLRYDDALINLSSNLIGIDSTLRTFTVDWYPTTSDCQASELVADIYLDQNLLDSSSPGMDAGSGQPSTPGDPSASTAPSSSVMFQYNSTQFCAEDLESSTSTFRTIAKLGDVAKSRKGRSTLQAYPLDEYISQVSMYAINNATGETVPMQIILTWGTVVNFKTRMNKPLSSANNKGIYLLFDVSRSGSVKVFVYCVVIANWIVTASFLWWSIACIIWENERVVKDVFVVPVTALFAFTTVRANMPGAPNGFGAYIDFVGILPNLVLLTLSSSILLVLVLARRVNVEISTKEHSKLQKDDPLLTVIVSRIVEDIASREIQQGKQPHNHPSEDDMREEKLEYIVLKGDRSTGSERESGGYQGIKRPYYGKRVSSSAFSSSPTIAEA